MEINNERVFANITPSQQVKLGTILSGLGHGLDIVRLALKIAHEMGYEGASERLNLVEIVATFVREQRDGNSQSEQQQEGERDPLSFINGNLSMFVANLQRDMKIALNVAKAAKLPIGNPLKILTEYRKYGNDFPSKMWNATNAQQPVQVFLGQAPKWLLEDSFLVETQQFPVSLTNIHFH